MNEFNLIDKIKQKYYRQSGLIKGIGDDAAVFKQEKNIVTAVDTFVENVHFIKGQTMHAKNIGYRCLAANISDLAAMGAVPSYYLVSVVIPDKWTDNEVLSVFEGLESLAETYKMDLIGGDTVSGATFVLSITVIGYCEESNIRYRSAAKPGDYIFVTGNLGNAAAGLSILLGKEKVKHSSVFIEAHQYPKPQVEFSRALADIKRVCLNDVSDGISSELNEIAHASNVSMIIKDANIPIDDRLSQFSDEQVLEFKYSGGEDFELVGTIPQDDWTELVRIAKSKNIKLTYIGKVIESADFNKVIIEEDMSILKPTGYIHLK